MSLPRPANRVYTLVPPTLSAAAFMVALVAGLSGWERHTADEQLGAHLFQLLIVAQLPVVLAYFVTAGRRAARVVLVQAALAVAAFVPVAAFGL